MPLKTSASTECLWKQVPQEDLKVVSVHVMNAFENKSLKKILGSRWVEF